MKRLVAHIALLLSACIPLTSHESVPPTVDSNAARSVERMERQSAIDSLAAGRRRWQQARIVEYQLQTSYHCFCVPDPNNPMRPRDLLTIRNGRIIKRTAGKGHDSWTDHPSWTVDSLFDVIADDLAFEGRKVRRLELNPEHGVPVHYYAGRVEYEDDWIEIFVDSFAVARTATRTDRRQPR